MAIFYRLAYLIGFTPWEAAANHPAAAKHFAALLDRETQERHPPYGAALDLGCGTGGWAIDLARRGWTVTGIDMVPRAIARARRRAAAAGVDVNFVEGDLTALRAAGVVLIDVDTEDLMELTHKGAFAIAVHEAHQDIPSYLAATGITGITLEDIAAQVASRCSFRPALRPACW